MSKLWRCKPNKSSKLNCSLSTCWSTSAATSFAQGDVVAVSHGRPQLLPSSCSFNWNSSKDEHFVKPRYHSGCCVTPVLIAHKTFSWHLDPGEALSQDDSCIVGCVVSCAAGF